tara:strand:- start:17313 stop:17618 length:306 start_codon:yes stop_codon:yes gene_type:complete
MQKYLSIPVKNEDNQLVLVNDVAIVEQASTTAVDIIWTSGKKVTVAHDTMAANNEEIRNKFQDYILEVLQYNWQKPSVQVSLAGITDAGGAVPEITGLTFS